MIELLVTISIIAILLSLVIPMLGRTVAASRGFKCQQALRSVAYDFQIFSDDNLHGYRGTDANGQPLSPMQFTLENFVESQYGVDEFWAFPGETRHDLPDAAGSDPMRCPEVKGPITVRNATPCTQGAISPHQNVSFGFNIRLRISPRTNALLALTRADIEAAGPEVPLVWDIDGAAAVARNRVPFFSGPSLDDAIFRDNQYWFPAMRHNRAANFAFIDGHVASSARPLAEPTWDWAYSPRR
jgi:prepilin-type processing-associated H-X9-DG protein